MIAGGQAPLAGPVRAEALGIPPDTTTVPASPPPEMVLMEEPFVVQGVAAAADSGGWLPVRRNPVRAIGEIAGVNLLVWSYDRFIREGGENPEFRVSFDSVWENIKNGFEWDNNNFGTNNFAHPWHGSLYFTAARSNGYDYWESIPFAFGGSLLWEYTGEVNNPAYNDWINTSVGGMALGESLYRLSDLLLDNTATGAGRQWREIGGLLVSPMRGINRLISGEWSRVGPNAPDRLPNHLGLQIEIGARNESQGSYGNQDTTGAFVSVDLDYGDPFTVDRIRPFGSFDFSLQLNTRDVATIGRIQSHALLYGRRHGEAGGPRHVVGAFQYFDYVDNRGYEFGGHTVGGTVLSRFGSDTEGTRVETELAAGVLLLGGTSSDVVSFTGRAYDYGSGALGRAGIRLLHDDRSLFIASTQATWLYTLNGAPGEHIVTVSRLQASLPLPRGVGVGGELRLYTSDAWYDDFGHYSRRLPEARLFLSLESL
jgi:hypothetical protein